MRVVFLAWLTMVSYTRQIPRLAGFQAIHLQMSEFLRRQSQLSAYLKPFWRVILEFGSPLLGLSKHTVRSRCWAFEEDSADALSKPEVIRKVHNQTNTTQRFLFSEIPLGVCACACATSSTFVFCQDVKDLLGCLASRLTTSWAFTVEQAWRLHKRRCPWHERSCSIEASRVCRAWPFAFAVVPCEAIQRSTYRQFFPLESFILEAHVQRLGCIPLSPGRGFRYPQI